MPSSRSSAQNVERPTLAPTWLVLLLAAMVCGALWLLYPRQALERRLAASGDSELATLYLNNLFRSDPNNPRLRLLLAQRQIEHGDTASARATLAPALRTTNAEVRQDALWLQWQLLHHEYLQVPEREVDRHQALYQQLQQQVRQLARYTWPKDREQRLALLAHQYGQTDIAQALTREEAPRDPLQAALYYERAAKDALAQGDYAGCAQFYLLARGKTPDAAQAKAFYNAAVATLQSGNQPLAALELAEREIGPLADDPQTLYMIAQLARAAGRPDVAEKYARRLLRMALERQYRQQADAWAATPSATPHQRVAWRLPQGHAPQAGAASTVFDDGARWLTHPAQHLALRVADQAIPELPFDDKIYTLGYEVFLENRKLEDAWAVANAAVRQNPTDLRWRERLAQVSEWTQRPALALENWLMLAQKTDQANAWQAVLRLAPAQFDDAALVQALRHQLRTRPNDERLVRALVDAQERLGEPQPAIDYLRQHANSPALLELLAQLAERAGQPDLALDTWRRLLALPGQINPTRAMHAAVLALSHRQPDLGLQWLAAVQDQTPPQEAAELWRFTGQLADNRAHDALAIAAYRKLVGSHQAEVSDYDALIRLLQRTQPEDAAQMALLAWQQYGEQRHYIEALALYTQRSAWPQFQRTLALLEAKGAQASARMRQSAQFMRLLGGYYHQTGHFDRARSAYQAALALEPQDNDTRQALLWLFIDGNDAVALRQLLAQHERSWGASADLHDALAAAYQALSLPQTALQRYLTPALPRHQHDFLWLMNYADALDQNQQADQAWRLRRYLLAQQRQLLQKQGHTVATLHQWLGAGQLDEAQRIARARLVLTQRPGDPARAVLGEILRLDQSEKPGQQLSDAAAETLIGWLQDAGQYGAERGYLWQQYARSHGTRANRPLWAEITVALAEDDKAATGQLLEQYDARLPRYDRVNAAATVGDVRLAQSAAFEAQDAQTDDAPLHLQLTDNLLAFSNHAATRVQRSDLGALQENQNQAELHWALSPRLALDLNLNHIQRQVTAHDQLRSAPDEDFATLLLRWRHYDGETRLSIAGRQGYQSTTPILLEHEQRLDNRLTLSGDLGWHLPSDDSLALRVGGMKTRVAAHLRYQATRQDSLLLSQWSEQYRLQTGAEVGRASHTGLDYSHTYRQDAPSLEWGAFWSSHRYERRYPIFLGQQGLDFAQRFLPDGAGPMGIDYFLPDSFQFYGVRLSTNMRYEQDYTRALRPFASISLTHHSELGAGYDLRLGLAGNVLGPDHLRLSFGMGRSGVQSLGLTRTLELAYRLYF